MAQFADKTKGKKRAWLCHKGNPVTPNMVLQPPWSSEAAVTCRFSPDHSTRPPHPLSPHFLCTTLHAHYPLVGAKDTDPFRPFLLLSETHIRLVFQAFANLGPPSIDSTTLARRFCLVAISLPDTFQIDGYR